MSYISGTYNATLPCCPRISIKAQCTMYLKCSPLYHLKNYVFIQSETTSVHNGCDQATCFSHLCQCPCSGYVRSHFHYTVRKFTWNRDENARPRRSHVYSYAYATFFVHFMIMDDAYASSLFQKTCFTGTYV